MKYQVNLYPERVQRAATVRQGILRGSVLGVVVGAELLLIGLLVISGFQVRGRVNELRASIVALEARAHEAPETAEIRMARQLVQERLDRVDWASTVETVARALPADLILAQIDAGTGRGRGGLDGMDLNGRSLSGSTDLGSVIAFMQALRDSATITRRFPLVDLGTAGGQGRQDFHVVLRRAPATEAPQAERVP